MGGVCTVIFVSNPTVVVCCVGVGVGVLTIIGKALPFLTVLINQCNLCAKVPAKDVYDMTPSDAQPCLFHNSICQGKQISIFNKIFH